MHKQSYQQSVIDNRYKIIINHHQSSIIVTDYESNNVYQSQKISFKFLNLRQIQHLIKNRPQQFKITFEPLPQSLQIIINIKSDFIQPISESITLKHSTTLTPYQKVQYQLKLIQNKLKQQHKKILPMIVNYRNQYHPYEYPNENNGYNIDNYDQYQNGDQILAVPLNQGTYILTINYFYKCNVVASSFYISAGSNYILVFDHALDFSYKVNQWVPILVRIIYRVTTQAQYVKFRGSYVDFPQQIQVKNIIITAKKVSQPKITQEKITKQL